MITVQSNVRSVMAKYRNFPDKVVRPAVSRSINDTMTQTRNEFGRRMVKDNDLPASVAKGATTIKRSTIRTLTGTLTASGKPISLKHYGARKTATGVSAKIQGQKWQIPGGFRVKAMGNHWYRRRKDKREPYATTRRARGTGPRKDPRLVYQLTGPALPDNVTTKGLADLKQFAQAKFADRMERNVAFYLRRTRAPR